MLKKLASSGGDWVALGATCVRWCPNTLKQPVLINSRYESHFSYSPLNFLTNLWAVYKKKHFLPSLTKRPVEDIKGKRDMIQMTSPDNQKLK